MALPKERGGNEDRSTLSLTDAACVFSPQSLVCLFHRVMFWEGRTFATGRWIADSVALMYQSSAVTAFSLKMEGSHCLWMKINMSVLKSVLLHDIIILWHHSMHISVCRRLLLNKCRAFSQTPTNPPMLFRLQEFTTIQAWRVQCSPHPLKCSCTQWTCKILS